jgi:fumarate reductase subunit C
MKNFIVIAVNLGVVAFVLAALGTFLNYLFGLSIGFKGEKLPDDPVIGAVFLVMAAIFGGAAYFVNKKTEPVQEESL